MGRTFIEKKLTVRFMSSVDLLNATESVGSAGR